MTPGTHLADTGQGLISQRQAEARAAGFFNVKNLKTVYFKKFAKVINIIFANIYHSPSDSFLLKFQKSIILKPPNVQLVC